MNDPFASPTDEQSFSAAPEVSSFPKVENLRGHLLLIRPTKIEENILSTQFSKPGKPVYQDRITADVVVLDGPIDGFDGNEFTDMYFSQTRLTRQLKGFVRNGGMCLARLDTRTPGKEAKDGNPWGLETQYTPEDAELARAYLRGKSA